jgi:hypothetical protein
MAVLEATYAPNFKELKELHFSIVKMQKAKCFDGI